MTQSQVFQKTGQLKAMKGTPGTLEIGSRFSLLPSARIIKKLIANSGYCLIAVPVNGDFVKATRSAATATTLFTHLGCHRRCCISFWAK